MMIDFITVQFAYEHIIVFAEYHFDNACYFFHNCFKVFFLYISYDVIIAPFLRGDATEGNRLDTSSYGITPFLFPIEYISHPSRTDTCISPFALPHGTDMHHKIFFIPLSVQKQSVRDEYTPFNQ